MKHTFAPLALALALVLSACGGGKAQFTVGGNITGLNYDGLVLTNAGANVSPKANATTFAFPNTISYGEQYNVTITGQPRHQTCQAFNYSDTAGRMASISVSIGCSQNSYVITPKVIGLTSGSVVLTNGSTGGTLTFTSTDTTEQSFLAVNDGTTYGITVLTQPAFRKIDWLERD
ncbi:MAG: hypothetical protein V4463_02070, partial [Pseudomonadota bacterium]